MLSSRFQNMYFYLHFFIIFSCLIRIALAFGSDNSSSTYVPSENIALNCGSVDTTRYDGRNWTNDFRSEFVSYHSDTDSTTISSAMSMDSSVPQVPYMTARVFRSNFTYTFNVTPGPKFVRLHFYPSNSFPNLNFSQSFMTVTSGNYSLLRNFSALSTANYMNYTAKYMNDAANYMNYKYFFREFVIQVENHTLDLTFSPLSKDPDAFAFVNGIEIVSMPENLYINRDKLLPFLAGSSHAEEMWLDSVTALETAYRINVGGQEISPKEDTGMFRTWAYDLPYLFGAAGQQELSGSIKFSPNVPAYTAPENVYRTSRTMGPYSLININYNMSWFFPVDTGFIYLVRLHFCQVFRFIAKVNQQVFDIYINNQTAQRGADIIAWTNEYAVPIYKDYAVKISAGDEGKQDLWLELHPNKNSGSQYYDASLNGVEIFKICNYDGNLAGLNPPYGEFTSPAMQLPSASKSSSKKKVLLIFGCLFGVVISAVLLFSLLAFRLKMTRQTQRQKPRSEPSDRFSFSEIKAATNNFDEALVIGSGSFGIVYKGNINGTVAIKLANQASISQASYQYGAEITALSKLHHHNIVSLLGYCREENVMILVYEYMSNGTLFDHLHLPEKHRKKSPLTWNQRLDICIGAARGLHYLHTGMNLPIIHRDIKTTNILIDSDWTAKVSDFGLSKVCLTEETNSNNDQLSMNIRGSVGYIDPEYYRRKKLTEKSDVYSFGVVLLEVISARQVLDPVAQDNGNDNEDQDSFVEWALKCVNTGDMDQLIDPPLRGKIKGASVARFLEVARKCLEERCRDRPFMSEVVCNLELALQLQESEPDESEMFNGEQVLDIDTLNNSDVMLGVEFSDIMVPVGR